MSLSDVFSGSSVFDRVRGFLPFFQSKYAYSVKSKCRQFKIHTYRNPENSTTFVLEPSKDDPLNYYMTGYGVDVKKGDFIVIEDDNSLMTYKVDCIDYYLDPPDLWMASLIEYRDLPKQN
jgi:hypothetical protein